MTDSGTIILPVAGRSSRFPNMRPKWMLTAPTGELMVQKSMESIAGWCDKRVVIGALSGHLELGGAQALDRAFGRSVEIIAFNEVTSGPAETVATIIEKAKIEGPVFVKDCDSWFAPQGHVFRDCVCYADLRMIRDVPNIAGKSFLHLNENNLLLGILEKNVSSNFISVGGYGFHEAGIFTDAYQKLGDAEGGGEIFVSHIILEAIRAGTVFTGIEVDDYVDVGTIEAWNRYRSNMALFVVDIDGVVLKNAGQYVSPLWDDPDEPLMENVELLKAMVNRGSQLIFVTARPERYRAKTESTLAGLGLTWHAAVFGVNHATRTLINDFANSNPFPSAVAVNIPRNSDDLQAFLGRPR